MKKAIFLGVKKIHSKKQDKDFRTVSLYTPPFKDAQGYERGGVETLFTDLDSTVGQGIAVGSIVIPTYEYNHYSQREELTALQVVCDSPYSEGDLAD